MICAVMLAFYQEALISEDGRARRRCEDSMKGPAPKPWIESVELQSDAVSPRLLHKHLRTKAAPWKTPWQRPAFDRSALESDLDTIRLIFEDEGYFSPIIRHEERSGKEGSVRVSFDIKHGPPVEVSSLEMTVNGNSFVVPAELDRRMPIRTGMRFRGQSYREAANLLVNHFETEHRAFVKMERSCEVNPEKGEARIYYALRCGPPTRFGPTRVKKLRKVDEKLVLRERAFREGEPYDPSALKRTRDALVALRLFSSVRVAPDLSDPEAVVIPVDIELEEQPPREIRIGAGYATDEQLRALLQWNGFNLFNRGHQLSLSARHSHLETAGDALYKIPYFPAQRQCLLVNLKRGVSREVPFDLERNEAKCGVEHAVNSSLNLRLGWKLAQLRFSDLDPATRGDWGNPAMSGVASGPTAGASLGLLDDELMPRRGGRLRLDSEYSGPAWGEYHYLKMDLGGSLFLPAGPLCVLAMKLNCGSLASAGRGQEVPPSARYFCGGDTSVRGYGRWEIGPRSSAGDPLGGRSLTEGSLELRRILVKKFFGAVFYDAGGVSSHPWRLPGQITSAVGAGAGWFSPVGLLRLDVGVPYPRRPAWADPWRIHINIGQPF